MFNFCSSIFGVFFVTDFLVLFVPAFERNSQYLKIKWNFAQTCDLFSQNKHQGWVGR